MIKDGKLKQNFYTFEGKIPISKINSLSSSFKFLEKEPDFYSIKDLKKRYI